MTCNCLKRWAVAVVEGRVERREEKKKRKRERLEKRKSKMHRQGKAEVI